MHPRNGKASMPGDRKREEITDGYARAIREVISDEEILADVKRDMAKAIEARVAKAITKESIAAALVNHAEMITHKAFGGANLDGVVWKVAEPIASRAVEAEVSKFMKRADEAL